MIVRKRYHMGITAENIAAQDKITREEQVCPGQICTTNAFSIEMSYFHLFSAVNLRFSMESKRVKVSLPALRCVSLIPFALCS